eukprot:Hpha_TRINITY_DN23040_c0_g1::TRINITY_DN23040_c0_g1_i1::g.109456::m.109456/K15335/NSUN2; tRNA (cytosine34-C5)-methyltransferase
MSGRGRGKKKGGWKAGRKEDTWRFEAVSEAEMKNAALDRYYVAQKAVFPTGEEEWEKVLACLRTPLPTTWRISDWEDDAISATRSDIERMAAGVKERSGEEGRLVPKPVPWYPLDRGCWQVDAGKRQLMKAPETQGLHDFLVGATEAGKISRQELVSMVPPLFLNISAHHLVLDVCAAPGSKTAQIMEMLAAAGVREGVPVTGLVVANDLDAKRCEVLVRQTMRLRAMYPHMVVTNHNGAHFPQLRESGVKRQFDRILCDVVCSGDGTLRKSVDLWRRWTASLGSAVHKAQIGILRRCMELLKVGGRVVYSTCSMNPVEDEAVLASCILGSRDTFRVLDVSSELPQLRRCDGVHSWVMVTKDGVTYSRWEDVPEAVRHKEGWTLSMFPPSEEKLIEMGIRHSMRFLPHLQDTGGFFVAVLEKTAEAPSTRASRLRKARPAATPAAEEEEGAVTADSATAVDESRATAAAEPPKRAAGDEGDGHAETSSVDDGLAEAMAEQSGGAVCRRWGDLAKEGTASERALSLSFLPLPAEETKAVCEPLAFGPDFPADRLFYRATARARVWKVQLVSTEVRKIFDDVNDHPAAGGYPRLKVVSTGLRLGEITWTDKPHFRPTQEAAQVLAGYASAERLRWVSRGLLLKLLATAQTKGPWELTLKSEGEDGELLETAPQGFICLAVRGDADTAARLAPPPGVRPAAVAVVLKRTNSILLRCEPNEADRLRVQLGATIASRKTGARHQGTEAAAAAAAAGKPSEADTGADADADADEPPPKRARGAEAEDTEE